MDEYRHVFRAAQAPAPRRAAYGGTVICVLFGIVIATGGLIAWLV